MITPAADTLRTSLLPMSAIRNRPSAVTATPPGRLSCASVARPPSPLLPAVPVPATQVIMPVTFPFKVPQCSALILFSTSSYRDDGCLCRFESNMRAGFLTAERGYEDEIIVVIHKDCPLHKIVRTVIASLNLLAHNSAPPRLHSVTLSMCRSRSP